MPTRAEILLQSVTKESRIVEIGPSFAPIAPKAAGWNSVSIDHMTREGLAAKYQAQPGVDVGKIETVDFVWTGGMLSDAVPEELHGSFDVFLASHVVEHTPDFVAFLDAAQALVKPDGVVILAVPDKRCCFDYFQPATTTGQVLQAHAAGRTRHSGERAFDHFAYAVTDGGLESWAGRPSQGIRLIHALEPSARAFAEYEANSTYHDLHAWHFVPSSFELLLLELGRLGETDWAVERIEPTGGWEFFVWLRRGAGAGIVAMSTEELDARRLALLKQSLLETQAQIDWLLAGDPTLIEQTHFTTSAAPTPFAATKAALAESRAATLAAMQRVSALESSMSWRVTAPLRSILDRIRRIRPA